MVSLQRWPATYLALSLMKLLTHSETAPEMGLGGAQMRTDRKAGAMPSASLLGRNWVYPPECIAEYRPGEINRNGRAGAAGRERA